MCPASAGITIKYGACSNSDKKTKNIRNIKWKGNSKKLEPDYCHINDEKTEFLLISSWHKRTATLNSDVVIENTSIPISDNAHNLGIVFDRFMTMDKFITLKCQSVSCNLCCIS